MGIFRNWCEANGRVKSLAEIQEELKKLSDKLNSYSWNSANLRQAKYDRNRLPTKRVAIDRIENLLQQADSIVYSLPTGTMPTSAINKEKSQQLLHHLRLASNYARHQLGRASIANDIDRYADTTLGNTELDPEAASHVSFVNDTYQRRTRISTDLNSSLKEINRYVNLLANRLTVHATGQSLFSPAATASHHNYWANFVREVREKILISRIWVGVNKSRLADDITNASNVSALLSGAPRDTDAYINRLRNTLADLLYKYVDKLRAAERAW